MLNIQKNINLKKYHTLGFDVNSQYFVEIKNEEQLLELSQGSFFEEIRRAPFSLGGQGFYVLGEGSNTFFTKDYEGLVILNKIKYIKTQKETTDFIFIEAGSGEVWDAVISYALSSGFYGPENLTAIPGTVGASVVQNIGAYGVEISKFVESVKVFDLKKKSFFDVFVGDCEFGYRDSIFKNNPDYFVLSVVYKFYKNIDNFVPNIYYSGLSELFEQKKDFYQGFLPRLVGDIIRDVRSSKLPDYRKIGTAGSFFKNVFVNTEKFQNLQKKYPDLKQRNIGEGKYKLSTGQLIELSVGKGFVMGGVGNYEKHALILVNNGNGTVEEFKDLIKNIKKRVFYMFEIELESEVVFV